MPLDPLYKAHSLISFVDLLLGVAMAIRSLARQLISIAVSKPLIFSEASLFGLFLAHVGLNPADTSDLMSN